MKLFDALRNIVPTRIKTAEEFQEFLTEKHEAVKIFGIKFSPKYNIDQDVLDLATKGKGSVKLPENTRLTLFGAVRKHFKFITPDNSELKIKKPETPPSAGDSGIYENIL